ncbi:XTP/dITP diphosphatase [Metabacillus fastidiosus]|uniref:XTP/dITP diphosphatase n=1 Tax=Metabacillus fastidiosus TaxID=1458 RepID=UPI002DB586F3|nr:XTP/dITP diphosphatase [Metabacillus fastidiosus]MEC2076826.1 XTP/dITP diphosphatase [Metabacillus fastidiosus]
MTDIIIATKNSGKAKEFQHILKPLGYNVHCLLDFPDGEDVEETGQTFIENAILKAEAIAKKYGKLTIADDSGLVIDYLNGAPGIFSARYAGLEKNDLANINKVLNELANVPKDERTARFICALAIAGPTRETITVEGTCEGYIADEMIGTSGFGYDPIFVVKDLDVTMAQLSPEQKNKISHRANAMKKLESILNS